MQSSMNFHFLVIPAIMFSILGFSQNKSLDNIEMYYDQGVEVPVTWNACSLNLKILDKII